MESNAILETVNSIIFWKPWRLVSDRRGSGLFHAGWFCNV